MPVAAIPENEAARLEAVRKTRLFGTPSEQRFDKITRLARQMFGVEMALIDLVGENVNWLKSTQGFRGTEAIRNESYCQHTILQEGVTLIRDARTDSRVYDNPARDTWVFYAGTPLHFDGHRVGALCIGGSSPRDLNEEQITALTDLAQLAERELEVVALSEAQAALAASNRELELKANLDVLTHIWNRGAILDIAHAERARASMPPSTAVLMIDIDHFKKINDTHGHPAGDEVLRVVAERLRASLRPQDAIGRYGGEEFLAVLAGTTVETGIEIGRRICEEIAASPVHVHGKIVPVTCSIGCAASENTEDNVGLLIERADIALYQAKQGGRNRAIRHTPA